MAEFVEIGDAHFFIEPLGIAFGFVVDILQKEENLRRDRVVVARINTMVVANEKTENIRLKVVTEDLVVRPIVVAHRQALREIANLRGQFALGASNHLFGTGNKLGEGHVDETFSQKRRLDSSSHQIDNKIKVPMKSPIKFTIAALALGLAIPAARAQDAGTPPPPPPPPAGEHGAMHKERGPRGDGLKFFTEKLGLTQDQQAKIKPILADQKKALDTLGDDASIEKGAKRAKSMEIRKAHREQIRALLTPEQQKKLDELKEEHGRGPGGPGEPKEPKE